MPAKAELLNLKWKDVNRAERRATLHNTKNRDRRLIYFQHEAASVLDEMARTPHISGFLFANADGNNTFPRRVWKAALVAAGEENFTFHDLRHTAASHLAMSGATLTEIAAFLGHRTLAMVQRYSRLAESHSEAVAGRMAEKYLS